MPRRPGNIPPTPLEAEEKRLRKAHVQKLVARKQAPRDPAHAVQHAAAYRKRIGDAAAVVDSTKPTPNFDASTRSKPPPAAVMESRKPKHAGRTAVPKLPPISKSVPKGADLLPYLTREQQQMMKMIGQQNEAIDSTLDRLQELETNFYLLMEQRRGAAVLSRLEQSAARLEQTLGQYAG